MRAVRLHAPGEDLLLEEMPLPEPEGTEVRVRVAGCGGLPHRPPHRRWHAGSGELPAPSATNSRDGSSWSVRTVRPAAALRLIIGAPWWSTAAGDAASACSAGGGNRAATRRGHVPPGFQADGGYAEAERPTPILAILSGSAASTRFAAGAPGGCRHHAISGHPSGGTRRPTAAGRALSSSGAGALGQFALQLLRLVLDDGRDLFVAGALSPGSPERLAGLGADVGLLDGRAGDVRRGPRAPPRTSFSTRFAGTDSTLAHAAAVVVDGPWRLLVGEAGGHSTFGIDGPVEAWLTTVAGARRRTCATPSVSPTAAASAGRSSPFRWPTRPPPTGGSGRRGRRPARPRSLSGVTRRTGGRRCPSAPGDAPRTAARWRRTWLAAPAPAGR